MPVPFERWAALPLDEWAGPACPLCGGRELLLDPDRGGVCAACVDEDLVGVDEDQVDEGRC